MSLVSQISKWIDSAKRPENLPVAIAVGSVAALGAGMILRRVLMAPYDGPIKSDVQRELFRQVEVKDRDSGESFRLERIKPTTTELNSAYKVLGDGLYRDPIVRTCAAEGMSEESLRSGAAWLFGCVLRATAPSSTGSVVLGAYRGSELSGVVVAFPPGADFDHNEFVMHDGWRYPFVFSGWERLVRWPAVSDQVMTRRTRLTKRFGEQFVYVMLATGDDAATNAAVDRVLMESDRMGLPTYTETTSETDAPRYIARGFVEVERLSIFGLKITMFVRPPHDEKGNPRYKVSAPWLAGIDV